MASEPSVAQPGKGSAAQEVPDAIYGGSYFAANHVATRNRLALSQDIDVDVCVIGGGLAGLTVAREVARKGWTVAVLEAKRIAWNASGRNTGFVLPGFAQDAQTIVERVGMDAAREVWGLSQSGADYVREAISDGKMQGMEQSEGWLHVSKTDRTRALRDQTELLRNLGADVEFWPEQLVRSKLKSNTYFQAVHFPTAFAIHSLNYALGLADLAEQAGARIFENTTAVSIDPAGVRKRIMTAKGRVRASHIVLAGNTHIGKLTPQLSNTLIPIHTFAIVTKPLGPELAETIDYPGSVSDTERADNHYRIIGGDRLMWAGRMTVWDAKPRRFGRRLRRDLSRRFPQLKNAEVDYAWSGELGMTVHRMPQIGEVTPGVWLASGFAGQGLNTTAMAGDLIARAVVEGDDRWRQFQPFELVWAGGRNGRIILQSAYWGRRQYDKWASKLARAKELRRIRMEPILKKRAERAEERARLYAERMEQEELARVERVRVAREQMAARLAEKARIAAERAEAKRIRDEQRAIERAARAEEQRILDEQRAVERAEAARVKAIQDAENARIRAEQDAENARLKAEQKAARKAEKERLAAEKAEAKRLEAERRAAQKAAEEAARIVAARVADEMAAANAAAAEAARIEAESIAAEQAVIDEAARIEAERIAAEEAAVKAAEADRAEAELLAAEETARQLQRTQAEGARVVEVSAAAAEDSRPETPPADQQETAKGKKGKKKGWMNRG
jgi:glycine/D-amino acid oxidase-like deaminating enzyme